MVEIARVARETADRPKIVAKIPRMWPAISTWLERFFPLLIGVELRFDRQNVENNTHMLRLIRFGYLEKAGRFVDREN
jgi:hypothetical protein